MMLLFRAYVCLLFFIIAPAAQGFEVDTLMKVVTKENEYLEITGQQEREYIYTQLTQVVSDKNGGLQEIPFEPGKVSDWPVIVEPGEIVLDKRDKVRVRINRNGPRRECDIVLGLSFIPEKISVKSSGDTGLQISVGYKSWLFIPGKSKLKGQVTASRKNGFVVIENMTNKILRLIPAGCGAGLKGSCNGSVISLPGTIKKIETMDGVRTLNVYLIDDSQNMVKVIAL